MKELTLNTAVNGSKSTSKIVELTKKQTDIIIINCNNNIYFLTNKTPARR